MKEKSLFFSPDRGSNQKPFPLMMLKNMLPKKENTIQTEDFHFLWAWFGLARFDLEEVFANKWNAYDNRLIALKLRDLKGTQGYLCLDLGIVNSE